MDRARADHSSSGIPAAVNRELFSEAWWLDAVAPGHWHEAVLESGGRRQAELRYTVWRDRLGFTRLGVGPLSPRMGPLFDVDETKVHTGLARENELVAGLVAQLPRYDYLSFTFPARLTNWMPFHWLGFHQTTRYSYLIDEPADGELAWKGMSDVTRNIIRKAERTLQVDDGDASTLMRLAKLTFSRHGIRMRYDEGQLAAGVAAARARNAGAVRLALDPDGRAHAGALFVWDDERVYYLVGANDPDLRSSGASSLIIWNGIKLAGDLGLRFDFEGSMIEPIERFFRGFGGRPEPYLHVTNTSRRLAIALAARDALQALTGRRPADRRVSRAPANARGDGTAS